MKNKTDNKLKCQITGNERISNERYLEEKAYKNGISVAEFKAFYVSKGPLTDLSVLINNTSIENAAIEYNRTEEDIKKMIGYNGRGKVTRKVTERIKAVEISTEDAAVALELAQAEIERTKEALVEKNQTSANDLKNARRRELYAEKKRAELVA